MKTFSGLFASLFGLMWFMLVGCQPIAPAVPSDGSTIPDAVSVETQGTDMVAATIVLPDGISCDFAGTGATLAFDEQRLNYTCAAPGTDDAGDDAGDEIFGLLGEPAPAPGSMLSVEVATVSHGDDGFSLESSEELTFLVTHIELVDGTACAFAGQGATLAFEQKRLNYTCGQEGTVGLLGDFVAAGAGIWTVEKATLGRDDSGFVLESSELVPIALLSGSDDAATDESAAMDETEAEEGETNMELTGTLTGTVAYLQRIALVPGSVIEVHLEDVSRADVAATVLASQTITTAGENVPIPFELTYDPADIEPNRRYALRVRITVDGELRWINTQAVPVLTNDSPTTGVDVIVSPV